jgi:hypothetical protein
VPCPATPFQPGGLLPATPFQPGGLLPATPFQPVGFWPTVPFHLDAGAAAAAFEDAKIPALVIMSHASSPNRIAPVMAPMAMPALAPVVSPAELPPLEGEVFVAVHAATLPSFTEEK